MITLSLSVKCKSHQLASCQSNSKANWVGNRHIIRLLYTVLFCSSKHQQAKVNNLTLLNNYITYYCCDVNLNYIIYYRMLYFETDNIKFVLFCKKYSQKPDVRGGGWFVKSGQTRTRGGGGLKIQDFAGRPK